MIKREFESLDEVIAEQNRLMNGKIPRRTEAECEETGRLIREIMRKDKEKRAQEVDRAQAVETA